MKAVILQIISIILQSITYTYLFGNLSKIIGKIENISKNKTLMLFICSFFSIGITSLIKLYLKIPLVNTLVICILFIFIEKLILNINLLKSTFITIMALTISIFTEYISMYLCTILFNRNIEEIVLNIDINKIY